MACLEQINIQPMIFIKHMAKGVTWTQEPSRQTAHVPHIFFDDGEPWIAANQYALDKLHSASGSNIKTIVSNMNHLRAYACWLEKQRLDWRDFPTNKKDRCLFQYRGFLVRQRDIGLISPSTATSRMGAVIQFYRWANVHGWIERKLLWDDKIKYLKHYTAIGFSRTISVLSSELAIPNRKRPGLTLEEGLLPLTTENRDILIRFLRDNKMEELYLIMMIGFFSGARSETIRTLRLENIENTLDDITTPEVRLVKVGPGTKVKTKFGVSGYILLPTPLLQQLERYAYSARRLVRQSKANNHDKTLLFLTERGNQYSETSFTKIISYLREKLVKAGLTQFKDFKFHQTRATFGTHLMRFAIDTLPSQVDAVVFVRDAMLHKDESTTWKYIKFIEREPVKEKLSEEFFNLFSGNANNARTLIEQATYDDYP